MNKIHFMYVPMTGLGLHNGYRGDDWLTYRINIFKNYVARALLAQTKKEFIVWFSWRPEEKNNPIVKSLIRSLDGLQSMRFVHTFYGICFWDDKYEDSIAEERLRSSLKGSLNDLTDYVPKDTDLVYMTIQPSDDMYLPSAVETIQKITKKGAFGWKEGYLIDYHTKEISEYNPDTRPPFYTIVFDRSTFLDTEKHLKFTGPYKSHEFVPYYSDPLKERMFVVGTHGRNISTVYNHPWKGRVLTQNEQDSILIATNVYFSDPIPYKHSNYLFLRKLFNKIPFNNLLRDIYHKLPANLRKL